MRNFSIKEQTVSRPELRGATIVFSSDPHNSAIMRMAVVHETDALALTFTANGYLDSIREHNLEDGPVWNDGPKSGYDANGKILDPHADAEEAAQEETRRLQAQAEGLPAKTDAGDVDQNGQIGSTG